LTESKAKIADPLRDREPARTPEGISLGTQHQAAPPRVSPSPSLQSAIGNRAIQRLLTSTVLQPKLTIGAPDDVYVNEADAVAEQVVSPQTVVAASGAGSDGGGSDGAGSDDGGQQRRMSRVGANQNLARQMLLRRIPIRRLQQTLGNRALVRLLQETLPAKNTLPVPATPELRRKCACGGQAETEGECAECRASRLALQRQTMGGEAGAEAPSIVEEVLRTPGPPLADSARGTLEPGFGHDFSQVRVHDDSKAAESATSVSALAYTVGNHIVFGAGQYAPGTTDVHRLLAHELTHTIQQTGGTPSAEMSTARVSRTTTPAVQRDGDTADQTGTAPAASVTVGPFTVTTFDGLLAAGRWLSSQLTKDAADVPAGEPSRTAADDLVKQEQAWEPTLQSKGSAPLDQAAANQANVWTQAFKDARQNIENYKKAKARADVEKTASEADEAQAANDQIDPGMADLRRAAFLNKKDELLEKMSRVSGMVLQANSALLEIHEKCMEMVGWLSNEITHVDELIEKFGPIAEAAHKVHAAYEGLSSALTLLRGGEGATEVDQAASKASAGLGLAGAAGSLTGMASGYMLYFGSLLMVGQACIKVIGVIGREHKHEFNTLYIEENQLDSVDWSAEPGGRETFDFMVKVMHAGSSTDIPLPVPKEVDKLMVDSGEQFEKGTGEEVPTSGFWFWKHTDQDKIKYWLMKNRSSVWAMLYGSISPPG
jgi:hypothetical protein